MADLKNSALGGFVWLSGGRAAQGGVKVLVVVILARLLTPEDFGLVAAAMAVIWFTSIFSKLGIAPALVQREDLEERHISVGFTASLAFGLIAGVIVFLLAPVIATFFDMEGLVPVVRVLSTLFPIMGLAVVGERLLQRALKFDHIAAVEVGSHFLGYAVAGIGLALLGAGVWALVGAQLVKESAKSLFFLVFVPYDWRLGADMKALGDLLSYGGGYSIGGLSIYFALQGDNLVIARFLGASALGLYGRAYELMVVPAKALGSIMDQVLFPTMSRVQGQQKSLALAFRRGLSLLSLLVLPASAATLVLAPEVVRTLLGEGWEGTVLPLQILAFGMYFRIAYMLGQTVCNASGAVYRAAWRSGVYAVLVVGGALVGQRWGIPGVAAAVLFAVSINYLLIMELALRLSGLPARQVLWTHVPALLLTGVVLIESWGLDRLLEQAGVTAVPRLFGCSAALLLTIVAAVRFFPLLSLGEDGLWMVRTLTRRSPERVRPILRRVLGDEMVRGR